MGLEKVIPLMLDILQRGKDVEIRTCKDGYKVLEVTRRTEVVYGDVTDCFGKKI